MPFRKGDTIRIESWKHGNKVHKIWKESIILKNSDPLILANYNAQVTEGDGKKWISPGLAIAHFSGQRWFHTVLLYDEHFRLQSYYCNIASPYQYDSDKKTLTYIDYDLDLIVKPSLDYRWVDQEEFAENSVRNRYPVSVITKVKQAQQELVTLIHSREEPFSPGFAETWYHQYLSLTNESG
ncbi:DUF402 domain-containing protein [Paenactinomyces guangxiensis]|uniref:DUF402 domain-containing protein n=1 Tax=Paenactinomyces guangxiensis TaxID=1490290 RepID=A0A7W1WSW1_9BACL|nr:DUF402 domain-containing protein [Paenactinomyces guangxiensis]MBA4495460.1 DUF402 domain-containing protein [Paenactinomyces guangxiensis]MBH8592417.1 DUF402 domain-containing protein [Paenactinomyces guangxiensis]